MQMDETVLDEEIFRNQLDKYQSPNQNRVAQVWNAIRYDSIIHPVTPVLLHWCWAFTSGTDARACLSRLLAVLRSAVQVLLGLVRSTQRRADVLRESVRTVWC